MELILALIYSVTIEVLYVSPKIRCFMRGQNHIDVKYHYVRDVISQSKLKVFKISTHDNPADMMIKPVPVAKFELCSSLVGLTV